MKKINTCCGSHIRNESKKVKIPVLPNPKLIKGVSVIYIGTGNFKIKGTVTKAVYYASDHSRHFKVYPEDADSVLFDPNIILEP